MIVRAIIMVLLRDFCLHGLQGSLFCSTPEIRRCSPAKNSVPCRNEQPNAGGKQNDVELSRKLEALTLAAHLPVSAHNGGLFVSRGVGIHPDRTIDSHELILVRSGTLAIQEETRAFHVSAGETILLFPHRRHFGTHPYDSDLSFYWIHFDLSSPSDSPLLFTAPQQIRLSRPDDAITLCHRFLHTQETDGNSPTAITRRSLLLMLLLAEVATANAERDTADNDTADTLAARADTLIRIRFTELSLSTQAIADSLACNADYLGRTYRRVYGKPLTDALHEQRLRHARSLLLDGEHNINEIARASGFSEAGYFRRLFKRYVGITPQGFRRLHARTHINTR